MAATDDGGLHELCAEKLKIKRIGTFKGKQPILFTYIYIYIYSFKGEYVYN